jgi:Putative Ig domain
MNTAGLSGIQTSASPVIALGHSLVAAPQGMTINENTGLISWNPGTQTVGNYSINVRVEDELRLTQQVK